MAAFTVLEDGTLLRYHLGPCFDECRDKDCTADHAGIADLFPEIGAEERAS